MNTCRLTALSGEDRTARQRATDHCTRRLLGLAITAALGRWEEFRLHVRAGMEQDGFTIGELRETLMQTAIYAGVPAANTAFSEAQEVLTELETAKS